MSLHSVRRCDECGTNQGETNHWWAVVGSPAGPQFMTSRQADKRPAKTPFRLDHCSHKCVTTAFNRWLDTGTTRKRAVVHPPDRVEVDAALERVASATAAPPTAETEEYAKLLP